MVACAQLEMWRRLAAVGPCARAGRIPPPVSRRWVPGGPAAGVGRELGCPALVLQPGWGTEAGVCCVQVTAGDGGGRGRWCPRTGQPRELFFPKGSSGRQRCAAWPSPVGVLSSGALRSEWEWAVRRFSKIITKERMQARGRGLHSG